MRARSFLILVSCLGITALLAACGGQEGLPEDDPSVQSIESSLELSEDGGFDMGDELPMFGRLDLDELDLDPSLIDLPALPDEMNTLAGTLPPDPNTKPMPPPCPHGFLKGNWKHIKKGYGVFLGKWATVDGKVTGHLKGIYGPNKNGHNIFFGKYISKNGKFMGLLKGRYGKQHFKGIYRGKNGAKGMLVGVYGQAKCLQTASGAKKCFPGVGKFVGKWHAFCPMCQLKCLPGWVQPPGRCICVPAKVLACVTGKCPKGTFCDHCPPPPGCKPNTSTNTVCAAVCGPPTCVPLPPNKPSNSDPNKPSNSDPAVPGPDSSDVPK